MQSQSILQRLLSRLGIAPASATSGNRWELPASPSGKLEAARWAYRIILLREPESRASLEFVATNAATIQAMREMMLNSAEARALPGNPVTYSMTGNEPPQPVQVEVAPEERERLFRSVQAVWHSLGERQPHWSVVTAEAFRPENIDGSLDHFYASGESNVTTLLRTLERNGIDSKRLGRCMDFGCGVGRLTVPLARHFEHVHAVDVSASHLAIARDAFARRAIANVTTHLLETIEGVAQLPRVDLVYSVIVLQHNPPPVIRAMLAGLLGRLDAGGVAVIQIPTYLPAGYRFDPVEYATQGGKDMEMHALPQREVFATANGAGVRILEVLEDAWTGYGAGSRSNTFVMQRPA